MTRYGASAPAAAVPSISLPTAVVQCRRVACQVGHLEAIVGFLEDAGVEAAQRMTEEIAAHADAKAKAVADLQQQLGEFREQWGKPPKSGSKAVSERPQTL